MRMLMFVTILTNLLSGCSSMRGNVVPQQGPTMEQVYDTMSAETTHQPPRVVRSSLASQLPVYAVDGEFKKLANPALKIYVFPHLAGNDEVPIPGYYTVFNAYEHDHYALRNDRTRE